MKKLGTPLAAVLALAALTPPEAEARPYGWHQPAPTGTVFVTNRSGGTVQVTVADRQVRTLVPYQTEAFTVPAGEPRVEVSYLQFGAERVLVDRRVSVPAYRSATVDVAPERTARLLIQNANPEAAMLVANGRVLRTLAPFADEVVALPVGGVDLELRAVGTNRLLGRTRMDLRAFTEPRWRVEAPRHADVVVVNPLPIAVDIVCPRGLHRTVPARGRTVYEDVPLGSFTLTAYRTTGELVDREQIPVRAGLDSTWTVDPPQTGLVQLDSDHWLPVTVRVDRATFTTLAPDQDLRIELPLGDHHLQLRDAQGRVLLDTWLDVDPYRTSRVDFGYDRHTRADDGRADADDRYDDRHDPHGRGQPYGERDDDHRGHDHGAGGSCTMD